MNAMNTENTLLGIISVTYILNDMYQKVMNPTLNYQKKSSESMNESVKYLSNKDDSEEESVGVDQALALLPGPAAAHERHHKDHPADNHKEDRRVDIVVPQEVQVVLGIDLRPSTKTDENAPSNDE